MNFGLHRKVTLLSRNESKIKCYESCWDLRAWSHDQRTRDRYLRDWMKSDMPICVIPSATLVSFLRTMVYNDRSRVPPRCHPNCKSKVILESICNSCDVINECIKKDGRFEKIFEEEEFETSHWPCERCMSALKVIKTFWKIMLQRVFNVSLPNNEYDKRQINQNSVKNISLEWENEIIQQAAYVRNVIPRTAIVNSMVKRSKSFETLKQAHDKSTNVSTRKCKTVEIKAFRDSFNVKDNVTLNNAKKVNVSNGDSTSSLNNTWEYKRRYDKYTCVKVRTRDVSLYACISDEADEITTYKVKLEQLQNTCKQQKVEVDHLSRENHSLREELYNVYQSCTVKDLNQPTNTNRFCLSLIPKNNSPHEINGNYNDEQELDSETIITMKKCKNKNFHHVSLLQVLHKSNNPTDVEAKLLDSNSKKENPADLLTKVQETFTSIVKREVSVLTSQSKKYLRKSTIDATSQKLSNSQSAPSCTTVSSESLSGFTSAKDN